MRNPCLVAATLVAAALFTSHAFISQAWALPRQPTVDARSRIEQVLVYSTRAKVWRTGWPTLRAGVQRVRLASLPTTVDLDSVEVRAKTTRVERVEVAMARGRLPRQAEAEKLLEQIEALDDKLRTNSTEKSVYWAELSFVRNLRLREPPAQKKLAQPEGVYVDSWRNILRWVEGRTKGVRKRLLELRTARRKLRKDRRKLLVAARQLDLSAVGRPQLEVTATVKGRAGKHKLSVIYLVRGASWRPSYDLRYDHRKKRVEAIYYANVQQRTGEDWKGASLRFSTARAQALVAIPELPSWTLGRKRDFVPRPRKRRERREVRWRARRRSIVISAAVRRLRALVGIRSPRAQAAADRGERSGTKREKDNRYSRRRWQYKQLLIKKERRKKRYRRHKRGRFRLDSGRRRIGVARPAAAKPKPAPEPARDPQPDADDDSKRASGPPPVAKISARKSGYAAQGATVRLSSLSMAGKSTRRRRPPTERLPWTDVGYRPPYLPADSPAAAAKGYLFTLYAPGKHDVPTTGAKRRIPLLRTSFRVSPVYRLAPGKSKLAYLMAELSNTSGRPILRGHANLFSGTMFSGRSYINTALPGHKMVLPLGVDDSVKVERHLTQRTVTEGVLFKDDVTEYTISIELANHRRYPITVDVRDQVPLKSGRKIEIRSFSFKSDGKTASAAKATKKRKAGWTGADDQGRVVWIGTVRPGKVRKISFSFRISRPKDWLLSQYGG